MNSLINRICNISFTQANSIIKQISGIIDYFSSEDEKTDFISIHESKANIVCDDKVSYGDWQTPIALAETICDRHVAKYGHPDIVIEPTCGLGAFIFSALAKFPHLSELYALEINHQYTTELKYNLLLNALSNPSQSHPDIYIYNDDFFKFDFSDIIKRAERKNWNLAIIGNPPWVTNSRQGTNNSLNVPVKKNSYGLKGIDAITGKSNFDISEYITRSLLEQSQVNKGGISFLLKNSVIRNILEKQKSAPLQVGEIEQSIINASNEFNVSVDASCFSAQFNCKPSLVCSVKNFYTDSYINEYGWVNDAFVSDTALYNDCSKYDNHSTYVWRSGIKHDCAPVLELTRSDEGYTNGFGEKVIIENDMIYPLIKSSDISNYNPGHSRKYVIVPQRRIGEETSALKHTHPLTYAYLMKHAAAFASRKSSIYRGKDAFSIFGIGNYSFKPYKIVVSSLYKTINFLLISQIEGKPVMVDDTCYQLDFDDLEEATNIYDAINSNEIQSLIKSLVFRDAKRVITKSLLMRLNLTQYCNDNGLEVHQDNHTEEKSRQLYLFD